MGDPDTSTHEAEKALDKELEQSFPASDPPAMNHPHGDDGAGLDEKIRNQPQPKPLDEGDTAPVPKPV